jgi:hypothetical protein
MLSSSRGSLQINDTPYHMRYSIFLGDIACIYRLLDRSVSQDKKSGKKYDLAKDDINSQHLFIRTILAPSL